MKIGPGRNSKSPSRWFQIDEPVTSEGIRSGVNWIRLKPMLGHLRERPRRQRLREARVVLEQHVPVGEQADQHELERLALADDGALDLVEDPRRVLLHLGELHQSASSETTTCRSESRSIPRPKRSCGGSRSSRTSSHVVVAERAPRSIRARVEVDPAPRAAAARTRSGGASAAAGSGGRTPVVSPSVTSRSIRSSSGIAHDGRGRAVAARHRTGDVARSGSERAEAAAGGRATIAASRSDVDAHERARPGPEDGESDDREHQGEEDGKSPERERAPHSVAARSRCACDRGRPLLLGERLRREQVVAHRLERVDRLVLHLRPHRMLRELSPFEQVGERACRPVGRPRARRASGRDTRAAPRPACAAGRARRAHAPAARRRR